MSGRRGRLRREAIRSNMQSPPALDTLGYCCPIQSSRIGQRFGQGPKLLIFWNHDLLDPISSENRYVILQILEKV